MKKKVNYANIEGNIVRCDIIKKYDEDSTALVKAYYSEYHSEYKYVAQDEILTLEEGELILSMMDRHNGVYVKALNVCPDDSLKEMSTSDEWRFIRVRDRVLKVHIFSALF